MNIRLRSLPFAAAAALLLASCGGTSAYPNRPITFIVPWGAGGGTDAVARIMASLLERDLGKPVNVVNRTGGSGVVGHSPSRARGRTATRSASSRWRSR